MKRLLSLMASAVICLCMLSVFAAGSASAAENYAQGFDGNSQRSGLIDNEYNNGKGIFGDDREYFSSLDEKIKLASNELQMNIAVYIGGVARANYQTESFADDSYDQMYGPDTDGIFYYLDLSGKSPAYDYISTSGKGVLNYQESIDTIFTQLDYYLPKSGQPIYASDIYNAIDRFVELLYDYNDTGTSGFRYYLDRDTGKYFYYKNDELIITKTGKPPALWLIAAAIGAGIGGLTTLISYLIAKRNYKFKSKTNPSIYLSSETVRFTDRSDTFLRSYVTKHRIESSSGGGGGSRGGGGGGGGGGHGGGGHSR